MRRHVRGLVAGAVAAAVISGGQLAPAHAGSKSLPINLSSRLNTECISIGNANVVDSSCAGDVTSSYVEETLPKSGSLVTVGGVQFRWTTSGLRTADSLQAAGQELALPSPANGYRGIAFLCSHHGDNDLSSLITVRYTDGSKSQVRILAHDWKHAREQTAIPGVRVQYMADAASSVIWSNEGSISLAVAPIDPRKSVKSIVLSADPSLLIFAASLAPISAAPKKVTYVS